MSPRPPRSRPVLRFAKDLYGRFARSTHFHPRFLASLRLLNPRLTLIVTAVIALLYVGTVAATDYAIYRKGTDNRVTRFVERIFPYPAAVVNGEVIPLSRFRKEVDARATYAAKHNLGGSNRDIQRLVISQLVDKTLYAEQVQKYGIAVTDKDVEASMQDIYGKIGGQDKLASFLRENYGSKISVSDFRQWIRESLIESAIEHQILVRAHVSHILIAVPQGASDAQAEAARQKAIAVKAKIADPTQFADAAKQYSEDVASRDKGGDIGTTIRGSDGPVYSKDFEDAIFTMPLNTVSDPIRSQYGWHLALVDKREGQVDESMAQFTQDLRSKSKISVFIGNK